MDNNDTNFRILSLDGGGVRGVLSAQILSNIESYINNSKAEDFSIGQRFDLIAGTSTGGLIALALATGRKASEIEEFYHKTIPDVFSSKNKTCWPFHWLSSWCSPKYGPDTLKKNLGVFFGEQTLNDVTTDVCITSLLLQNAQPRLYKSGYLLRNATRLSEKLSDIALATSAAPTFFKAHSAKFSTNLVDGGVYANNPAMIALVEAFQFETQSKRGTQTLGSFNDTTKSRVILVSIGTGEQCAMPYDFKRLANSGKAYWGRYFHEVSIQSQSQLVHHQVKFLLGKNYLRINPSLKFPMELDDSEKINELKNISDLTKDNEEFLKAHF